MGFRRHAHPALMTVLDAINSRWGPGTLTSAAEGKRNDWPMRSENRSPRYTTQWEEIQTVRA